jgi:RNA polymerase sigma factor (sigma-70 family)
MSDADIVIEVLDGRHERFTALVERHFSAVYGLCLSYIRDTGEAEDAAQDAFVQGYNRLDSLKNPGKFAGWLASIARNICLNHLKSRARRQRMMTELARTGSEQEASVDAERMELRETVRRKVDELPAKTREAVYLYYFEELSLKEIAAYLGNSPNAVARLLKYGRRLLKDKLWDEAAESIRDLRPKEESIVAACAAIPFGAAPWCTTGGVAAVTAAAGIGKLLSTGGVIAMSTKSVVSITAVVALAILALVVWSPWATEPSSPVPKEALVLGAVMSADDPFALQADVASDVVPEDAEEPAEPVVPEESLAQDPVSPEPAIGPASVSGRVIDDRGYPIENATVHVEVEKDDSGYELKKAYTTTTDKDGKYALSEITEFGSADAYASAQGYVMGDTGGLKLAAGSNRDGVDFTLDRGRYFIAGQVVSESREPIPGASINLRFYRGKPPREKSIYISAGPKLKFTTSDSNGRFEMAIPWDSYCDFTVKKEGYGTAYFTRIATGTDDAMFVLRSGGALSGSVTTVDREPVEGATVSAQGATRPEGNSNLQTMPIRAAKVVTDADGNYVLDGLGEDYVYTVSVRPPAGQDTSVALGAAAKQNVRVRAAETTYGVDFVLQQLGEVRIYGTVTDESSGKPAYPVGVWASVVEPDDDFAGDRSVGRKKTKSDGSYSLTMKLSKGARVKVGWSYAPASHTLGGGDVETFYIEPGTEKRVDLKVDAPITVPLRAVDKDGKPVAGLRLWYETQNKGSYGSGYTTGSDGRFIYHGLQPNEKHRFRAYSGNIVVGKSAWFKGKPGETLPEVEIVCEARGGIEGVLVDDKGIPVAITEIGCTAVFDNGTIAEPTGTHTDSNGSFVILNALPVGVYSVMGVGFARDDMIYRALAEDVEIEIDGVTDLGTLTAEPVMTVEEAAGAAAAIMEQ